MTHDTPKLGGPNADVIERIEQMKRPKFVQPPPFDTISVNDSVRDQVIALCKREPDRGVLLNGVVIETVHHLPEDAYIVKQNGRLVGVGSFKTGKFTEIGQDFPPKHIYEPVK